MPKPEIRRNVDDLGRVVIPIEMRRALGLEPKDPVIIRPTDDGVEIIPVNAPREPDVRTLETMLADYLVEHPDGTPAGFVLHVRERCAA